MVKLCISTHKKITAASYGFMSSDWNSLKLGEPGKLGNKIPERNKSKSHSLQTVLVGNNLPRVDSKK